MKYHYSRSTWDKSREADVFEDQEKVLHVRFWEDQEEVGTIRYEDYSIHYVEDAVENWISFNFEKTTVIHYAI